ncbi:regulatory subunit of cyclin-dependent kinase [Syncephalastrum racemosum]|uniref:Cyclin-dependent kinases regulatory subunit n=1 Tax=Syncephalastrum racemosum TaxID=13706 RepID=A0A1X2HPN3_SYNRA|nr:regulatory subunit of cyclin-dependent kinase [Syncephalastrum racemosum]
MPDPPSHSAQKRSVDTTRLVRRHQPASEKSSKKDPPPPQEEKKEETPSKHNEDSRDQPQSEESEDANREAELERLQREVKLAQKYIYYSQVYTDDHYAYRHVKLPEEIASWLPRPPVRLEESEWKMLGVQGCDGWEHYHIYGPEPHILLLRRDKKLYEQDQKQRRLEAERKKEQK